MTLLTGDLRPVDPGWCPAARPLGGPKLPATRTQGPITCAMVTFSGWVWEGQGSGEDTRHLSATHASAVWMEMRQNQAASEVEGGWAEPLPPTIPRGFLEY